MAGGWFWTLLGKDQATQLAVEPKHFAARVSGRPMEVGARGAYSIGLLTGVLPAGLAANSEIFQARWAPATSTLDCLIRSIRVSASVSTTAFIAGVPVQLEVRIARAWSTQGTGGTGITFGSNDSKKRTDFATSAFATGDMRIATTAALGPGTKTLDGTVFAATTGQPGTTIGTFIPAGTILYVRDSFEEYPALLENQEGIVIRSVAVPGTGTWQASVTFEWTEIDPAAVDGWL